jgi:hypothetical protein
MSIHVEPTLFQVLEGLPNRVFVIYNHTEEVARPHGVNGVATGQYTFVDDCLLAHICDAGFSDAARENNFLGNFGSRGIVFKMPPKRG